MARQRVIVGIDVGTSKIATVVATPSGDSGNIRVIGAATVDSVGIKKSQIVDIEEAIASITKSVEASERMAGLSISDAVISIGGAHIGSQNSRGVVAVAHPDGEIDTDDVRRVIEAARAVSLPASQEILHVLPREYKVDSQEGIKDPVGMSGIRLEAEVHIVTASATAVRNLTKCLTELGITSNSLVYSGLASSESVLTPTEKELGVVLVDLGGGTTSIAIWVDGSLAHSAVLPIGARNITNDLAIGMRLSLDAAEKVKRFLSQKEKKPSLPASTAGGPKGEKPDEDSDEIDLVKLGIAEEHAKTSKKTLIDGIIRPRLQEVFTMVGMELKESGFGGRTPAGVVLTGGGAKTVAIDTMCRRVLSLPVRIGAPQTLEGLIDDIKDDPSYAVTEGLLLYAVRNNLVMNRASGSRPSLRKFTDRFPVKGVVNKTMEFLKQFLP